MRPLKRTGDFGACTFFYGIYLRDVWLVEPSQRQRYPSLHVSSRHVPGPKPHSRLIMHDKQKPEHIAPAGNAPGVSLADVTYCNRDSHLSVFDVLLVEGRVFTSAEAQAHDLR